MGKYAIIIIKEKNKYLQYYDKEWKSYLFVNCKINNEQDIEIINKELEQRFNLNIKHVNYVGKKKHEKFSVKHNKVKEYEHYFFVADISEKSLSLDENFICNNIEYKWFSYNELLEDKRIQEVNGDIVSFIKEFDI